MTVGDLRKALEDIPDELHVWIHSLEENETTPNDDIRTTCTLVEAKLINENNVLLFQLFAYLQCREYPTLYLVPPPIQPKLAEIDRIINELENQEPPEEPPENVA